MSGITDEDRQQMAELAEMDATELRQYASTNDSTSEWDESAPLRMPHRGGDGRRGVNVELCNAIRSAAEDGRSAREIAEIFESVGHLSTAHVHATGRCAHEGGDVPPVRMNQRHPDGTVSRRECNELRRRWHSDEFDTYDEAADWLGRARSCAYRHTKGDCGHD